MNGKINISFGPLSNFSRHTVVALKNRKYFLNSFCLNTYVHMLKIQQGTDHIYLQL